MSQTKNIVQNQLKPTFMFFAILALFGVSAQAFFGPPIPIPEAKKSNIANAQEIQVQAEEKLKEETPTDPTKDNVEVKSEDKLESTPSLDQEKDKSQIISRMTQFFKENKTPLTEKEAEIFYNLGQKYKIHPYAAVAIAFADSSLGKNLTTAYNLGNVGNTDTCPTCKSYSSWEQGIEAIFKTLTNKYLGKATKLCHLSRGGWKSCPEGKKINGGKFYASSTRNWDRNANYAASWLLNQEFNRDFNYKL